MASITPVARPRPSMPRPTPLGAPTARNTASKPFSFRLCQGEVPAQPLLRLDLHAELLDHADLAAQDVARQPVGGDGLHEHAARLARPPRRPSAGSPAAPGSTRRRGPRARRRRWPPCASRSPPSAVIGGKVELLLLVDHVALQRPDGQRLVQRGPAALALAGVEADPRADGREAGSSPGAGASASSKRFSPIRLTKPGTSTPAGQAFWHGARTSSGHTPGPALVVPDVLHELLAEVADGGEHRVGRGLAQAAERRVLDRVAQVDQPLDVPLLRPCPRRCGPGSPASAWCRSGRACTCRTTRPARTPGRTGTCPPCRCPRP